MKECMTVSTVLVALEAHAAVWTFLVHLARHEALSVSVHYGSRSFRHWACVVVFLKCVIIDVVIALYERCIWVKHVLIYFQQAILAVRHWSAEPRHLWQGARLVEVR